MSLKCASPSLELSHKAWAVLHLLAETSPDFSAWDDRLGEYQVTLKSYAWYNGRERGFVLAMRRSLVAQATLYVAFAECRNSDQLIVEVWEGTLETNPPTVESRGKVGEDAYDNRKTFNTVDATRDYIMDQLAAFYNRAES